MKVVYMLWSCIDMLCAEFIGASSATVYTCGTIKWGEDVGERHKYQKAAQRTARLASLDTAEEAAEEAAVVGGVVGSHVGNSPGGTRLAS